MHKGKRLSILVPVMLVAGCVTAPSDEPAPVNIIASTACPHVRQYSDEELCALNRATADLADDDPIMKALDDYHLTRKEARICRGEPEPEPRPLDCSGQANLEPSAPPAGTP